MAEGTPSFERFAQYRRYFEIGFHPGGDLLYVTDTTGQYNLWRQPLSRDGTPGYPRALTNERDRVVRSFACADDGRSVLVLADRDGSEFYQIERVWFDGREPEVLTAAPDVQHNFATGLFPVAGGELLFTDNSRARSDVDVVVRNLRSGTETRPFPTGRLWDSPQFDRSRTRIAAIEARSNTRVHTFVLDRKRSKLTEVLPHEEEAIVACVGWTADGRSLVLVSDIGRDFQRVELYDLATERSKVLLEPKVDLEFVRFAPKPGVLAYALNDRGYSTVYAGRLGRPASRLRAPKGAIQPVVWGSPFALAPDGKSVAALWSSGAAPAEILRLPVPRGPATWATDGMVGGVPGGPLPPPSLVAVPGPKGRPIPAFYYRPKVRPRGPAPAVLSIHGGPEAQERPSWQSSGLYAFLNSRGISVLAPNIRGSTGYGKAYQREIHHDWGGGELEDLKACAEWLAHRPEVDPHRLAVLGGSFGGFATLSCVTRLPEYWKAGVDLFGPSNLLTFAKAVPPHWRRFMAQWVGDTETEVDFLLARSPITYLDRVRCDLLIIQGAQDPRVVKSESDQVVERLRAAGRTVEYLVFENEGHGFTRKENSLKALGAVSRFLEARLL